MEKKSSAPTVRMFVLAPADSLQKRGACGGIVDTATMITDTFPKR